MTRRARPRLAASWKASILKSLQLLWSQRSVLHLACGCQSHKHVLAGAESPMFLRRCLLRRQGLGNHDTLRRLRTDVDNRHVPPGIKQDVDGLRWEELPCNALVDPPEQLHAKGMRLLSDLQ